MIKFPSKFLVVVFTFCLLKITVFGQDEKGIATLLSGPVSVTTKAGASLQGSLSRTEDGLLQLQIKSEDGEAIFTYQPEEIRAIFFPGGILVNRAGELIREDNLTEALPLLEAIYEQRSNFLPFVAESDLLLFTALPSAYLDAGKPANAIAVSRNLLPHLQNFRQRERLDEAVILGHFSLGLREETKNLAASWIGKRDLYSDSALGWWIQAHLDFGKGNYREALWTSLHPIVFSGQIPMKYLDSCYALAIAASHELKNEVKAHLLYTEMQTRGLDWPEDELLAPYRILYNRSPDPITDNPNK